MTTQAAALIAGAILIFAGVYATTAHQDRWERYCAATRMSGLTVACTY